MEKNFNYVFSESLSEMVISRFKVKLKSGGYRCYYWDDKDCVYWPDDVDDRCYIEVPKRAIPF